ncbi:MAG: hypothetical protein UZ01_01910 [Candidatus Brocadia sinica]|nr:MAG: hypothetical protein UZ01_01910 [Candidatus Brocadia sinica]
MKRLKGGVQSGIRCFRVYYLKYLIGLATVESDAHFYICVMSQMI